MRSSTKLQDTLRTEDVGEIRPSAAEIREMSPVLVMMCDNHLGNFLMSLPTIRKLSDCFRQKIDLLVDARYSPLAWRVVPAARIIPLNQGSSSHRRTVGRIFRTVGLILRIAARRYALVIDLTATVQSTTLTFASCCTKRVGFLEAAGSRGYTLRVARETQSYTPFRYAQMLTVVGESPEVAPIQLNASPAEHERCDHLLRTFGVDPQRPIVVIHPKTGKLKESDAVRCWPDERFAELTARLTGHYGQQVCLIGSPDETEGLQRIRRAAGAKSGIAPFVAPVNVLLALLEKGRVLISNESGPTHLAATTRIPIVTVFGPTPESRWRPFRDREIVLLRGAQCAPTCLKPAGPCGAGKKRALCVENVSVDQVLQAVDPYLA